ncbi:MAG: hypothetical protein JW915_02070 [Chitinispirillaceae bacterium]|nr:hypothetical protein [Chitinispirillaceae bacterium]
MAALFYIFNGSASDMNRKWNELTKHQYYFRNYSGTLTPIFTGPLVLSSNRGRCRYRNRDRFSNAAFFDADTDCDPDPDFKMKASALFGRTPEQ